MAKKKLAKVQDIPGMKIYDGPDGPEMYLTDKRGGWPDLYWEAKRICHKVRITYIESPESEPQTLIIAPYKLESSVDGWAVGDLPSEGFECKMYSLANINKSSIRYISKTPNTTPGPYTKRKSSRLSSRCMNLQNNE